MMEQLRSFAHRTQSFFNQLLRFTGNVLHPQIDVEKEVGKGISILTNSVTSQFDKDKNSLLLQNAIDIFDKIIKVDKTNPVALNGLAVARYYLHDKKASMTEINLLDTAVEITKDTFYYIIILLFFRWSLEMIEVKVH